MANILIIDDNDIFLTVATDVLENEGHTVSALNCTSQVEPTLAEKKFDLLITDIIMPEKEGIEIIIYTRANYPDMKILAITGRSMGEDFSILEVATNLGADSALKKPFSNSELVDTVNSLLAG